MDMIKNEKQIALTLTLGVFVVYLIHALVVDGSYGGGDGIRHYLVSRWSWVHAEQFLYHWGKPFFTLITSPFSQFGLIGIKIFNALAGALTALLCYMIARKTEILNPVAAVILASFAPIYMLCINSGLTEPLFAFILMWCIYLYLNKSFIVGTILLSFLPFVRSEGNLMFPLFALVLIYRKQWKLIPLLAFGTVVYSIVGYFHYDDIFWIKTKNPYTGSNYGIYGQGELLHYVNAYKIILGLPLTILFVAGVIWMIWRFIKKPSSIITSDDKQFEEFILVYGSFFIYFIAHSIFWWKGLFGSLGLERSMAGVIPSAALVGMRGLQLLLMPLKQKELLRNAFITAFGLWIIAFPFYTKYLPMNLDKEELLVKEAGLWFNSSEYKDEKVYYLFPYFMHILNLDAFDGNRVGELWGLYPAIEEWGIDVVPLNTVILWDAHFGANEAYIPLEKIMGDPNFKLIKSFRPEQPFQTLGGYDFEIYAFLRVKARTFVQSGEFNFDLEQDAGLGNAHTISQEKAHSGNKSSHMKPEDSFGILFEKPVTDFNEFKNLEKIIYSFKIYTDQPVNDLKAVFSIDDDLGSLQWSGKDLEGLETGKWNDFKVEFIINKNVLSDKGVIKLYTWNNGRNNYFIDDIKVVLMKSE